MKTAARGRDGGYIYRSTKRGILILTVFMSVVFAMRALLVLVAVFASIALVSGISVSPALAQSKTAILKYDKDGRVIGSESSRESGTRQRGSTARSRSDRGGGPNASNPANRYEAGEVVVANAPPDFADNARAMGFRIIDATRLGNLGLEIIRLRIPPDTSVPDARQTLSREFPGIIADANHLYEPSAAPPASLRSGSLARWTAGWEQTNPTCGRGVRLGMIDGALDTSHVALKGAKIQYKSFHKDGRKPAAHSHGTAVAALMVGKPGNKGWGGLLPGAELFAGNMFEEKDGKVSGNAVAMVKALDWMVGERVHVINMSIAGGSNKVLELAIKKAALSKTVIIAAAGNWGRADRPAFPAAFDDVVAVTAVGEDRLVYSQANSGPYIDFAAPGVKIWTAVPGGGKFQSGTSFATPFVAVLVGLAVQKSNIDTRAVRVGLAKQSADLGAPGKDPVFGFGLVTAKPSC